MESTQIKRKIIPYGYVAFTGKVFSNYAVDTYNRMQSDIDARISSGMTVPNWMYDEKHRHFCIAAGTIGF